MNYLRQLRKANRAALRQRGPYLYPWQRQILRQSIERHENFLLFAEPALGKTPWRFEDYPQAAQRIKRQPQPTAL